MLRTEASKFALAVFGLDLWGQQRPPAATPSMQEAARQFAKPGAAQRAADVLEQVGKY